MLAASTSDHPFRFESPRLFYSLGARTKTTAAGTAYIFRDRRGKDAMKRPKKNPMNRVTASGDSAAPGMVQRQ